MFFNNAQRGAAVIAAWSGPRNISTAMMRAWENRGDCAVSDEPLYAHYLHATGLDHPARDEVIASQDTDWRRVVAALTGPVPGGRPVWYQKHMTHHLLPGIDDGAKDLETSLEMARMAVEDGTTVLACTPHIYPGLYMNDQSGIKAQRDKLQKALDVYHIPLKLVVGADAHLVPELLDGLQSGRVPTLNDSRYFLLEPSHHVPPPHFEASVFQICAAGYIPVLTHPERLVWIEDHYPVFVNLARRGVWMQLTAGAILGKFGKRARYQ